MQELSGIPYAEVQFTKDGAIHDDREVAALLDHLESNPTSDLLVIAHGWNNDMDDARRMYRVFFERVREVLDGGRAAGAADRTYAILGLLWPSKKFAESELIPSGAASVSSPAIDRAIADRLDELAEAVDEPEATAALEEAKQLVPRLEQDPQARARYAELVLSVLSTDAADDEDASTELFAAPGDDIMDRLGKPVLGIEPPPPTGGGGAARVGVGAPTPPPSGSAAGLLDVLDGPRAAARNLANFATYYKMKERARTVGRAGGNQVLRRIRERHPDLRIHLIGHSFGGRLVTAAVVGPDDQPAVRVDSLTLLQAAFSHHGFAENWEGSKDGLFRRMVVDKMVTGPVLITCTPNDKAVGLAYPLASLIARQTASGLGDKNDKYGGIGRNGAQRTPEAVDLKLLALGGTYSFQPGKLYNLSADAFIADHSDICKNEVAYAILTAVVGTARPGSPP